MTFYALQSPDGRLMAASLTQGEEFDVYALSEAAEDEVPLLMDSRYTFERWVTRAYGGEEPYDVCCEVKVLARCKVVAVELLVLEA